jgi:hypothetical protein
MYQEIRQLFGLANGVGLINTLNQVVLYPTNHAWLISDINSLAFPNYLVLVNPIIISYGCTNTAWLFYHCLFDVTVVEQLLLVTLLTVLLMVLLVDRL